MKFFSVSVAAVLVLILLSTSPCRASVPNSTDGNHFSVVDSNMEFEFMMDSEFSRMLRKASPANRKPLSRGAVFSCGRAKSYCNPPKNVNKRRGLYDRTPSPFK